MTGFYQSTSDIDILRSRIEELARIRQGYAIQLGSSLYDATKNDADLRWGRESLYDGIAACDDERESILARIASIESAVPEASETAIEKSVDATSMDEEGPQSFDHLDEEPAALEDADLSSEHLDVTLTMDPVVAPEPMPEPAIEPAPAPEPEPEPEPVFEPAPIPAPEPEPVFEPAHIPTPEPEPVIEPTPVPAPAPVLKPEPVQIPEPEPVAAPQQGPTCPKCGQPVAAGDKFCMGCGSPLKPVAPPNICPACGNPVEPSYKFCMTCGHKLK